MNPSITPILHASIATLLLLATLFNTRAYAQTPADSIAIMQTIDHWEQGWNEGDVALAIQDYAEDVNWTNAFGDRVRGRDSLAVFLEFVLSLDVVRAGRSEYVLNDLTFLGPDAAVLRSRSVVEGQLFSDGTPMANRRNDHLRVLQRRAGKWVIMSHLVSWANERR